MRYFLAGLLVCTAGYALLAPGDSGVTLNPIRLIPKVFDWGYKPEAGSIAALARNVTTDVDELVQVFEQFLDSREDESLKDAFKAYLVERASTSFVSLEKTLDGVLSLYKFVLPFLLIQLWLTRGQDKSRGEGKGASTRSPNSKKFRALAKASVLHARAKKKHEKGDVSPMSVLADFE